MSAHTHDNGLAELWSVFFHEIVEEGLDFGWLAADLEECGLPLFLLMMAWLGGRERERGRDRGMGTQKVAAARLGMISAAVKHRREKMKRLGMSGWT